jgi:positive regulator of sigma E activity
MTDTGKINEIKENLIVIVPERSEACFGCMNLECKAGGFISAENPQRLPLKQGQLVEVKAPAAALLSQAAFAILPPASGFIAGFALIRFLFPGAGEGAAAGIGIIFLFAGALTVFWTRKKVPAGKVFTVTRVID